MAAAWSKPPSEELTFPYARCYDSPRRGNYYISKSWEVGSNGFCWRIARRPFGANDVCSGRELYKFSVDAGERCLRCAVLLPSLPPCTPQHAYPTASRATPPARFLYITSAPVSLPAAQLTRFPLPPSPTPTAPSLRHPTPPYSPPVRRRQGDGHAGRQTLQGPRGGPAPRRQGPGLVDPARHRPRLRALRGVHRSVYYRAGRQLPLQHHRRPVCGGALQHRAVGQGPGHRPGARLLPWWVLGRPAT